MISNQQPITVITYAYDIVHVWPSERWNGDARLDWGDGVSGQGWIQGGRIFAPRARGAKYYDCMILCVLIEQHDDPIGIGLRDWHPDPVVAWHDITTGADAVWRDGQFAGVQ